jgi:tripartite-type tricarboxylate transporter receptor subunit TctC
LPDVPTTGEAGIDFNFSAWNAMVAPKDTPKEIVAMLADALSKALDDPAIQKRYIELGSSAPKGADRGPAGLQSLVESEGHPHHPSDQGRRRDGELRPLGSARPGSVSAQPAQ